MYHNKYIKYKSKYLLLKKQFDGGDVNASYIENTNNQPFKLTIDQLINTNKLPDEYTCHNKITNDLTIRWNLVPPGTQYFALTVIDPDVPANFKLFKKKYVDKKKEITSHDDIERQPYYHWLVWNIGPIFQYINTKNNGYNIGKNSADEYEYMPPCPPKYDVAHRYIFTLYALKNKLNDKYDNYEELKNAIDANKIDETSLTVTYKTEI